MSRQTLTCAPFVQLREDYLLSEELIERAVSHREMERLAQLRARARREIWIATACYRTLYVNVSAINTPISKFQDLQDSCSAPIKDRFCTFAIELMSDMNSVVRRSPR